MPLRDYRRDVIEPFARAECLILNSLENGIVPRWSGAPGTRDAMPNDSHRRAAEYHELAAHAHRAAAAHHGKEEHSKQALEHANRAFQWSQEAHGKSEQSTG